MKVAGMTTVMVIVSMIQMGVLAAFTIRQRDPPFAPKASTKSYVQVKACVSMESTAGDYEYRSPGSDDVCGFYVIGEADELVELLFDDFHISCDEGGLLAVVDGWEAEKEFFPGDWDTKKTFDERYKTYCGASRPHRFLASQNVALVQFRTPTRGQGFRVSVRFRTNNTPCNVISLLDSGVYTITNYGVQMNCSLSLLSAQHVTVIAMDVGESPKIQLTSEDEDPLGSLIPRQQCRSEDRIELLDGRGLDPSYMWLEASLCGFNTIPSTSGFHLVCPHSVIRMVSSGKRHNSVTFRFRPINKAERKLLESVEC